MAYSEWKHFQGKRFCHYHFCLPSEEGQLFEKIIIIIKKTSFLKTEKLASPELNSFLKW